jgi:glutamate--cysteine ligase
MPKQRYQIMRNLMPHQGSMGLDMMQATCSLQVTLDFTNEQDMVRKFRVALALQPLATALFSYSPFARGRNSGYLSLRDYIWHDTDPQRCGSLPFVFEEGMGFERYVDYLLDVPMYFVIRGGNYIDAGGRSFGKFLSHGLPALPGDAPRLSDWTTHLTTVFPQVRLTRYLEMRGADAGEIRTRVPALAALWAGLLYDPQVLDNAWQEVSTWTAEERRQLETEVARQGFETPFRERRLLDLCRWMVDQSRQGLQRRGILDADGRDESIYLEPLQEVLDAGCTFAEILLKRFNQEWNGNIDTTMSELCRETLA